MRSLIIVTLFLCANLSEGQRIESLTRPVHYDLALLPIISGSGPRLCGHVFIDLQPITTTNLVTLHAADIAIIDVSVEQVSLVAESNESNSSSSNKDRFLQLEDLCFSGLFESVNEAHTVIQEEPEKQQLNIILKETLFKGKRYRLGLFYVAKVNDDSRGFFRANYRNDNASCCIQGWFGGTQMEPSSARKVLPCFDEPGFKTTYDISIGHDKAMTALSNMLETDTRPMENTRDWRWTSFSRSPPMPTYLLALFVTDYEKVERIYKVCNNRTVKMRFWGQPDHLPHLKQSIDVVPDMLDYMEKYVGQPFTLPKIDFIAAPTLLDFEAMENWGLILFRENRLFFKEGIDSEGDRFQVVQTMAHELAHQFFGNLVTCDWWSDIAFYEGMCGIFEFELTKYAMPNLTFRAEMSQVSAIRSAMKIEEHIQAASVIREVKKIEDTEMMFDPITYNKGSGLLLMLRNFVGHDHFRNAVVTFMERYQFQSVNSRKFMEILDEEVHRNRESGRGMNVTKIMNSWTTQDAYPIVRCSRMSDGRRIRLSQLPHPVLRNVTTDDHANRLWWIPISMTDASRPDFSQQGKYPRVWLTPERPTLEIPYLPSATRHQEAGDEENTWIILNGEFSGYTRVLYDDGNWRLISRQLVLNHTVIPQVTRAQLIDDAFTLALAELLDYQVVLELIEYLTVINDEFVRPTAQFHLRWMKERTRQNGSLAELFDDYMEKLKFERMDMEESNENNNLIRSGGFDPFDGAGCLQWSEGVCVDKILRLFQAHMDDTISPEGKRAMTENLERNWCLAMRYGGKDEWKWAWRMSLNDVWASQRSKILSSMSCSQDHGRLKQLLSRVFHPTIEQTSRDSFVMIEKMADNPLARPMVLNFIKTNWERLGQHFKRSGDNLKLLASTSKYLSTSEELNEISQFVADLEKRDTKLDRSVTTAILDGIRANIRWAEKHSEQVYLVLEARRVTGRTKNRSAEA